MNHQKPKQYYGNKGFGSSVVQVSINVLIDSKFMYKIIIQNSCKYYLRMEQ